jgi:hypothetical protein
MTAVQASDAIANHIIMVRIFHDDAAAADPQQSPPLAPIIAP